MKKENPENYISLSQAAELCIYTQEYLSLRARQGKLKAVKLGRNWVTTSDWVAEYCEHNGNGNGNGTNGTEDKEVRPPAVPVCDKPGLSQAPENLPVGELVVYKSNFKDWLVTKKPVSSVLLTALTISLIFAGGVFGKASIADVYDDTAPVAQKIRSDFQEGLAIADRKINAKLSRYAESLNDSTVAAVAEIGRQTISVDGQEVTVEAAVAGISSIWQGYGGWASKEISRADNFLEKEFSNLLRPIKNSYFVFNKKAGDVTSPAFQEISQNFSRANGGLKRVVSGVNRELRDRYVSTDNFLNEKIETTLETMAKPFRRVYQFAIKPWTEKLGFAPAVPSTEIDELRADLEQLKKEPVVVKRVEVSKVVEPVKEITKTIETEKRITKVDDSALAQIRNSIAFLEEEMTNRLYAPGGVISQTIRVTEPVQSPKIYQENGEIVLQTLGSGNVILSAATGLQLYGQQVIIESTNTLNPLIYLASKTRIGGDTTITGTANVGGGLGVGGDLSTQGNLTVVGNATVAGTQTISGITSITASSTSPILTVTQTGSGDILNLFDDTTEVFTVLDGGNIGIASSTPSNALAVQGTIMGSGDVIFYGATATTTIAGGLAVDTSTLFVDPYNNRVGIGTTTVGSALLTVGTTTPALVVAANGNVGIGTTAPGAQFDVDGDVMVRGRNTLTPPSQLAALELWVGRSSTGGFESGRSSGDIAIDWGGNGGGYRQWISTKHGLYADNDNAIEFFLNTTSTVDGSSAPGTGNIRVLGLYGSGNVGIGTAGPSSKLTVHGGDLKVSDGVATSTILNGSITLDYGLTAATSTITATSTLASINADSGLLYVDSYLNRVGIATTTPRYTLDVWGDMAVGTSSGTGAPQNYPLLYVQSGTDGSNGVGIGTTTVSGAQFTVGTTTPNFVVSQNGNVGLGTTVPASLQSMTAAKFTVKGSGDQHVDIDFTDLYPQLYMTSFGGGHPVLAMSRSGGTEAVPTAIATGTTLGAIIPYGYDGSNFPESGRITFVTEDTFSSSYNPTQIQFQTGTGGGSSAARMTIRSNGNVGIATTTPRYTLDVWGDMAVGTSSGTGAPQNYPLLYVQSGTDGSNGVGIGTTTVSGTMLTVGTTTPAFVVTSAGNVGIGTTAPADKLVVAGGNIDLDNAKYMQWKDTGGTYRSILYLDSSDNLNLGNNSGGDGGPIIFYSKTGFGESARIDANGNFGIGTTAPSSKLTVFGGDLAVGDGVATSTILNGSITLDYGLTAATSTFTATSTLASINADSGLLYVDSYLNRVGIATSTPRYTLDVWGELSVGTSTAISDTATIAPAFYVTSKDRPQIGIGTSTVGSNLLTVGTTTQTLVVNETGNVFAYGGMYQDIYGSDDGLVLYFPFSEGMTSSTAITAYDRSPYGNDGTLTWMATTTPSPWVTSTDSVGGEPCKAGTCLSFDGADDYVVSANSETDLTTFTAEAWIKPDTVPPAGTQTLISHGSSPTDNGWSFEIPASENKLRLTFHGAGNYDSNLNILMADAWQHVAVTLRGTTATFYLNGKQVGTATTGSMSAATHKYSIGATPGGTNFFSGSIDEVRVYNRDLSATEIRTHYLRGTGGQGTVLANKFRIVNATNTIAFQVDGAGNSYFNTTNVGIATTTPRYTLDVWGDMAVGTSTAISDTATIAPAFYVTSKDRPQIGIGTSTVGSNLLTVGTTTPAFIINEKGLIGMGTTTLADAYQLSIHGQLYTSATTTIADGLVVGGSDLFVSTNGKVGIGTKSPGRQLTILNPGSSLYSYDTTANFLISSDEAAAIEFNNATANNVSDISFSNNEGIEGRIRYGHSTGNTDYLAFFVDGTTLDKMRITSTGVGIATTTPRYTLDVWGDMAVGTSSGTGAPQNYPLLYVQSGDGGTSNGVGIGTTTVSGAQFTVGTTTPNFVVSQTGNVGIGTTNPGAKLDITGDLITSDYAYLGGTTSTGLRIKGTDTSNTIYKNGVLGITVSDGSQGLHFDNAANAYFSGVSVGIGTISPQATFDVRGASQGGSNSGNILIASTDSMAINKGGSLAFGGSYTGTTLAQWAAIRGLKENSTDSNEAGYLSFETRPAGGNFIERMRIDSSGSVGIGTTAPGHKLTVSAGDGSISGGSLYVSSDGTATTTISSATSTFAGPISGGGAQFIIASTTANLLLQPYGGNVGIGTTGPDRKLDVLDADNPQLRLSKTDGVEYVDFQAESGGLNIIVPDNGGTDHFRFTSNNVEWARFHESKFAVGGMTVPRQTIDVVGDGTNTSLGLYLNTGGGSTYGISTFNNDTGLTIITSGANGLGGAANQPLVLNPNGALVIQVNTSEKFRIDTAGNVGIGTTGPSSKLTVHGGDLKVSDGVATSTILNGSISLDYGLTAATSTITATSTAGSLAVGTSNLYVSENGRVGIGTATPGTKLSVNTGAGAGIAFSATGVEIDTGDSLSVFNRIYSNSQNLIIESPLNKYISFSHELTEAMRITGGLVGIATTTPRYTLDVWGDFAVGTSTDTYTPLFFVNTGASGVGIGTTTLSTNLLTVGTTTPSLVVTNNGNVGIRTTAPNSALDIRHSANFDLGVDQVPKGALFAQNTGTGPDAVFGDYNSAGEHYSLYIKKSTSDSSADIGIYDSNLGFTTSQSKINFGSQLALDAHSGYDIIFGDRTERVRFKGTTGFVGLSTSTPRYTLDVWGDMAVGTSSGTGAPQNYPLLYVQSGTDGTSNGVGIGTTTVSGAQFTVGTTTPNFVVSQTGNVGIGTTAPTHPLTLSSSANGIVQYFSSDQTTNYGRSRIYYDTGSNGTGLHIKTERGGNFNQNYANIILDSDLDINLNGRIITLNPSGGGSGVAIGSGISVANILDVKGAVAIGSYAGTTAPTYGLIVSGNVGIATTTPRYTLDVWGDMAVGTSTATSSTAIVPALYVTSKDRPQIGIGTSTVGSALLTVGTSTPALVVDARGNVGIGTTGPGAKLDVANSAATSIIRLTGYTADNSQIEFIATGHTYPFAAIRSQNTGADIGGLGFFANSASSATLSERMRITSTGNVGIGTTAPGHKLTVSAGNGSISGGDLYVSSDGTATTTISSATSTFAGPISGGGAQFIIASTTANLLLQPYGGNVGIGTTGTNAKLDVRSANVATDSFGNLNVMTTDSAANDVGGQITLSGYYSGTTLFSDFGTIAGRKESGGTTDGYLAFGTVGPGDANTEKMRITSTGNVGIGTTTPAYKMHVTGSTTALGVGTAQSESGRITFLSSGTAGDTPAFIETNSGSDLGLEAPGGFMTYNVQDSSFAHLFRAGGNEVMRIGSTVGIATTTPRYTLDVWGDMAVGTSTATSSTAIVPALYVTSKDRPQIGIGTSTVGSALLTVGTTTPALVVAANGNVGIGIASPGAVLDIYTGVSTPGNVLRISDADDAQELLISGDGNLDMDGVLTVRNEANFGPAATVGCEFADVQVYFGDGDSGLCSPVADSVSIGTAGLERLRVDASGFVGIATTTPRYTLDVWGDMAVGTSSGTGAPQNYPLLYVQSGTDGTSNGVGIGTTTVSGAQFTVGTTTPNFVVSQTGNVGIGTTAPGSTFTVAASKTINFNSSPVSNLTLGTALTGASNNLNGIGDIQFTDNNSIKSAESDGQYVLFQGQDTGVGLIEVARIQGAADPYFKAGSATFLQSGNVGIATTTPRYTLDVWGDMAVGTSSGTGAPQNYPLLYVQSGDGGTSNGVGIGTTTVAGAQFTVGTTTPNFVVSQTGNVGIGTTAPGARVELYSSNAVNQPVLRAKNHPAQTFYGSAIADQFNYELVSGANVAPYNGLLVNSSGETTGSIKAFAVMSGTSAFRLVVQADGNVGIATSTPRYTLDVWGDMAVGTSTAISGTSTIAPAFYVTSKDRPQIGIGTSTVGSNLLTVGTSTPAFIINEKGSAIFNEGGADADFRIESNDIANMFVLDASNNSITIGENPSAENFFSITPNARSGRPQIPAVSVEAHTFTDNDTAGSGTAALYQNVFIAQPTLAATNASVITTDAATFRIAGPPSSSTNQTLTNAYGLMIASADVTGTGAATNSYGLAVAAPTGASNNYSAIFTGGNVGIGTTGPSELLTVFSATDATLQVGDGTATTTIIGNATTTIADGLVVGGSDLYVSSNGNVGIGTTNPDGKLHVAGQGVFGNDASTGSDVVLTAGGEIASGGRAVVQFNRLTDDGHIVDYMQAGVVEGWIAVSTTEVTLTAFTGSHMGQTTELIERGELVISTGVAAYPYNRTSGEPIYAVSKSTTANDPRVLGTYFSREYAPIEVDNIHLISSVGNGNMWLVDTGVNIQSGDNLISSDTDGHGMVDPGTYETTHIVAKASENVDWSTVSETVNDNGTLRKHKKISVFYTLFDISRPLTLSNLSLDQNGALVQTGDLNITGNIGIGTTTPYLALTVHSTGGQKDVGVFNGAICADNAGQTKCYAALTAGTVYGDASSFGASDVAENYPVIDDSIEAGDVVVLSQYVPEDQKQESESERIKEKGVRDMLKTVVAKSQGGYDSKIIGVVSTQPGVLLGDTTGMTLNTKTRPVALSGRVPVKISAENGPVSVGDALTSSVLTPGAAMKATKPGMVIGMALESFASSSGEIGKIMVFINPHWSGNNLSVEQNGEGQIVNVEEQQKLASLGLFVNEYGVLEVGTLKTQKLCVGSVCVTEDDFVKVFGASVTGSGGEEAWLPAGSQASTDSVDEPQNGDNRPCSSEVGACQVGVQIYQDGVWGECIGAVLPTDEMLDEVDNDCDGQVDEGVSTPGVDEGEEAWLPAGSQASTDSAETPESEPEPEPEPAGDDNPSTTDTTTEVSTSTDQ